MEKRRVAVLGGGSWGTALAHHLNLAGQEVVLWARDHHVLDAIRTARQNPKYFPGEALSSGILTCEDGAEALRGAALVVFALPSSSVREIAARFAKSVSDSALIVSTAKGLEENSLKTMSEVLGEVLGSPARITALSGPSFAFEVLRGLPTAVTIAAPDLQVAKRTAAFFHYGYFRVYTSTDVKGVEVGGATKNIIALAVGMLDAMGAGNNARAALITRGLAEMQRLCIAVGGDARTISGLAGLGDLLLTSIGDLSRNRQVGLRLGKGEKLPDIIKTLGQVAEAVPTTPKILALAQRHGVSVPIVEQVHKVLTAQVTVAEAEKALLNREQTQEF